MAIFVGDVDNYLDGSSVNLDTSIGGVSLIYGADGELIGVGISGPSWGASVSHTGGVMSAANPSGQPIVIYNSNP